MPGAAGHLVPVNDSQPDASGMPSTSSCNCSCLKQIMSILVDDPTHEVEALDLHVSSSDTDNGPDTDDSYEGDADDRHIIVIKVRGSVWEEGYQKAIRACRVALSDEPSSAIKVHLDKDPANVKDKNAIAVSLSCQQRNISKAIVGYIGLENIVRVNQAMQQKKLENVSVHNFKSYFSPPPESKRVWQINISLTKKGKWPNIKTGLVYNMDLPVN